MKKNAHLHVVVSTEFLDLLRRESHKRLLTISEFCRLKLQESLQLDRIEEKLNLLVNSNEKK